MEKKRKIPYGVINWAKLVRECLFVDNTAYIRKLEDVDTPVFLRPKRFGKSIVCSMLAHYYDVNLKDRFDEFFGMTDIGRNPTPLHNSFLVLQFDFSTIQVGTLAEIERNFVEHVRGRVERFATVSGRDTEYNAVCGHDAKGDATRESFFKAFFKSFKAGLAASRACCQSRSMTSPAASTLERS